MPPEDTHYWPFSVVADGAKNLQNLGQHYFDRVVSASSVSFADLFNYLLSKIKLPAGFVMNLNQDVNKITSSATFGFTLLTIQNMLHSFWHFLLYEGPTFTPKENDGLLMKFIRFLLCVFYFVTVATVFFIIPTLVVAVAVLVAIYFNFGASLCCMAAGCIVAFIILNLFVRTWLLSQGTEGALNKDEAETIKKFLTTSGSGLNELSELIDSRMADGNTNSYAKSPLKMAFRWHLSLFNFYDRLLQPLLTYPPDPVPE